MENVINCNIIECDLTQNLASYPHYVDGPANALTFTKPVVNSYTFKCGEKVLSMYYEAIPARSVERVRLTVDGIELPYDKDDGKVRGSLKFFYGRLDENLFVVCERRNIAIVKYDITANPKEDAKNCRAYYIIYNILKAQANTRARYTNVDANRINSDFKCYAPSLREKVLKAMRSLVVGGMGHMCNDEYEASLVNHDYFKDVRSSMLTNNPKFARPLLNGDGTPVKNIHGEPAVVIVSSPSCALYSAPRIGEYAFSGKLQKNVTVYDDVVDQLDRAVYGVTGRITGLRSEESKRVAHENAVKKVTDRVLREFKTDDKEVVDRHIEAAISNIRPPTITTSWVAPVFRTVDLHHRKSKIVDERYVSGDNNPLDHPRSRLDDPDFVAQIRDLARQDTEAPQPTRNLENFPELGSTQAIVPQAAPTRTQEVPDTKRKTYVMVPSCVYLTEEMIMTIINTPYHNIPDMFFSNINEHYMACDVTFPTAVIVILINMMIYSPSAESTIAMQTILRQIFLDRSLMYDPTNLIADGNCTNSVAWFPTLFSDKLKSDLNDITAE